MPLRNAKGLLFLLFLFVFSINSAVFASVEDVEIEGQVVKLLQKRDVGRLANELAARKSSGSIKDLLVKLSVFARAGHQARVFETLCEIGKTYSSADDKSQIIRVAKRAIGKDDLAARKFYYENFAVYGDEDASGFISLWRGKGDFDEIEKWLEARQNLNETWWQEWLKIKKEQGAVDDVLADLERQIRANPADFYLIEKYLKAVSFVINTAVMVVGESVPGFYERDVSWLLDVAQTDSAYAAYELGNYLRYHNPPAAANLFQKSLSLPFTQKDLKMFGERAFIRASIQPIVKNPEKQLRFWTMTELAGLYRENNQPQFAQPIVEKLTQMDTSDIQAESPFELAGAVQAASGQRVVESKLLQDEAKNENSVKYWFERVQYYKGRNENDRVWQTYLMALGKFPYIANDFENSIPRLHILSGICDFGASYREQETEEILRSELNRAKTTKDTPYIFHLGWNISNNDFEKLFEEFFVNTDLLPEVLADRTFWRNEERYLIGDVMESENWKAEARTAMWEKLSTLARQNVKQRGYTLAISMTAENEFKRAIPFLQKVLKFAPEIYEGGMNYTCEDVERELFDAYIESGNWQKAEKMYLDGFEYWKNETGKIALAAAESGSSKDALRVWKLNANLDRRNLYGLNELAKTDAKNLLRDFYQQMKKDDPLTKIPDAALEILK